MKILNKFRSTLFSRMVTVVVPVGAIPIFILAILGYRQHVETSIDMKREADRIMARQLVTELDARVQEIYGILETQLATVDSCCRTEKDARDLLKETIAPAIPLRAARSFFFTDTKYQLVAVMEGAAAPAAWTTLKDALDNGHSTIRSSPIIQSGDEHLVYVAQNVRGPDGRTGGYVIVEIKVGSWVLKSQDVVDGDDRLIFIHSVLRDVGHRVMLSAVRDGAAQGVAAQLEARGQYKRTNDISGDRYIVTTDRSTLLPVRVVVSRAFDPLGSLPPLIWAAILLSLLLFMSAMILICYALARNVTAPLEGVIRVVHRMSEGDLDARVTVRGQDEVSAVAKAFNKMAGSLQKNQERTKRLYKSVMDLFACPDLDSLLRKSVELTCTQCGGDVAWFIPKRPSRTIRPIEDNVYNGLRGWAWKEHLVREVTPREASALWDEKNDGRVFRFTMRNSEHELGQLHVAFQKAPDDAGLTLLHSLIALIEMALNKQDLIHRGAIVTTELELAETVQRNILSDALLESKRARVAYHYQPASRLGGDWFFLIDDAEHQKLYVIMGDVTGHGLAQGLVTTAVKGALDVIEQMVKDPRFPEPEGPGEIVNYLETVVSRAAGSNELAMTCLAAVLDFKSNELKMCNAGHTFPIHIRYRNNLTEARHLHEKQQPMLGFASRAGSSFRYQSAVYRLEPGDLLLLYTDGLSEAKNLKSKIFGRFLFRSLRQKRSYSGAESLKSEILEMFRYYTQGTFLDDDVCFLVVQLTPENTHSASKQAG